MQLRTAEDSLRNSIVANVSMNISKSRMRRNKLNLNQINQNRNIEDCDIIFSLLAFNVLVVVLKALRAQVFVIRSPFFDTSTTATQSFQPSG